MKTMLGVADLAAMFDVEPKTVSIWRLRYPDFPEPDVKVGGIAGWDPARAEEIRAWVVGRPGRGRKLVMTEDARDVLRRIFTYDFMQPDEFAWAPIVFPGIEYDRYGVLADGMQAQGTAHLVEVIRDRGYDVIFDDPATDLIAVMHHILWDQWTEEEIGEHQFIGCLFSERGQIYFGCTAFDAATYTIERLQAKGGELCSVHQPGPGRRLEGTTAFVDAGGVLHHWTIAGREQTGTVWVPVHLARTDPGLRWIKDLELPPSPGGGQDELPVFRVPYWKWTRRITEAGTPRTDPPGRAS